MKRCLYCDDKIQGYGFKCPKCNEIFCNTHRLPESHVCIGLYAEIENSRSSIFKRKKEKSVNPYRELEEIENLLQESPRDPILLLEKARILNIMNKPGLSSKTYSKYLEIENERAEAWYEMGIQYEKLKKRIFAMNSFKNASELDPNNEIYRDKYQEFKKLQMEMVLGVSINQFKLPPKPVQKDEILNTEEIDVEALDIPEKLKNKAIRSQERKDVINDSIGSLEGIEKQIDIIRKVYDVKEDPITKGIIFVKIAPNFNIKVDLKNYPKRPSIELPLEISLNIGYSSEILRTLRMWDLYDETPVIMAINELRACIGFWDYAPILISERFIRAAFDNAEVHSPNEMAGFMRLDRWVIWGLESPRNASSTPVSVQFRTDDIPTDDSVIGMIHSHPLGNATPSSPDRKTFLRFHRNIIISVADKVVRLFDRNGRDLKYKIIDIAEFDKGKKSNLKLSSIIGRGSYTPKKNRDNEMFS